MANLHRGFCLAFTLLFEVTFGINSYLIDRMLPSSLSLSLPFPMAAVARASNKRKSVRLLVEWLSVPLSLSLSPLSWRDLSLSCLFYFTLEYIFCGCCLHSVIFLQNSICVVICLARCQNCCVSFIFTFHFLHLYLSSSSSSSSSYSFFIALACSSSAKCCFSSSIRLLVGLSCQFPTRLVRFTHMLSLTLSPNQSSQT